MGCVGGIWIYIFWCGYGVNVVMLVVIGNGGGGLLFGVGFNVV